LGLFFIQLSSSLSPPSCQSSSLSSFHAQSTPRAVAREAGCGWCAVSSLLSFPFHHSLVALPLIVILWWSCCPPLHSSPFRPMSVARGRGGWCCVTWVSCGRGCSPSPSLSFIVIILHCLVSNNKMQRERKKLTCGPRDITDISLALCHLVSVVLRMFSACPVCSHRHLLPP